MERVIHKYFDKMEDLEEKLSIEVENIVASIDIKAIMQNPLDELMEVIAIVSARLENDYHKEAFNAGRKLAKDIR